MPDQAPAPTPGSASETPGSVASNETSDVAATSPAAGFQAFGGLRLPDPSTDGRVTILQQDDAAALAEWFETEGDIQARTPVLVDQVWGQEWWMPIHVAAWAGAQQCLALLLEQGVHPDSRTRFRTPFHGQQTALHVAAGQGHAALIKPLIDAGADPDLLDAHRQTPLHLAARHAQHGAVDALCQADATPNQADANARTPLHLAVDALDQILGPSAAANESVNSNNATAANAAAALATIDTLLKHGGNPQAVSPKDAGRQTPLDRVQALPEGDFKSQALALFQS